MRAINVLLSIVVSLAIALLVFEGGLRLIGMGPPATLNRFDPRLGWSKKPSYELRRHGEEFDVSFRTNALGLRDDPMSSPAKPAGTFRVVMLGDSFTLGYTVEREDLFVDLLEHRWKAEGREVDVVNAGTEAYSTDQEVAWLLEHGDAFQPDLVVLLPYDNDVFWCGQDAYQVSQKPRFTADGRRDPEGDLPDTRGGWRRTTAVGRLLPSGISYPSFTTSGGGRVVADFAPLFTDPPAIVGDAEARFRGSLLALREACSRLGSELVVAPIPSNASVAPEFGRRFGADYLKAAPSEWDADRVVELALSTAADLGIRTVDARAAMEAGHRDAPAYLDFFGPDQEWHFNPHGNRVFADFLHDALEGLVPAKERDADPAVLAAHTVPEHETTGPPFFLVLYGVLWAALTALYFGHYRDEPFWLPPLKVGAILAVVFATFLGVDAGVTALSAWNPTLARAALLILVLGVLGFVAYKMGNRLATMAELVKAFALRGHWYLMPMVVVLLTIGSLLVVAATSPFVAPFIYTLF